MYLLVRGFPIWLWLLLAGCAPKGRIPGPAPAPPAPLSDQAARAPQKGLPEDVRRAQADGVTPNVMIVPPQAPGVDDREARKTAARLVWATPLGRMFSEYIYAKATPTDNFRKATALVDRLFESIWWTTYRTVAMQLMVEDLYTSGKIDPVINDRVGLLNMNIALRVRALEAQAAYDVRWQLPYFIIGGGLGGSKVVRSQTGAVYRVAKGVGKWATSLGGRVESRSLRRAVNDVQLARLFKPGVFTDYDKWKAIGFTGASFLTYLPIYYGLKVGAIDSASPLQKTIFYNLTWLIDLSNL